MMKDWKLITDKIMQMCAGFLGGDEEPRERSRSEQLAHGVDDEIS